MRLTDLVTPLKPLEAMAMGKVVLASDVGGHKELIQDHVTGNLFQAGNESDLAKKIIEMSAKNGEFEQIGSQARINVLEHRGWRDIVGRYITLYERLLSGVPGT